MVVFKKKTRIVSFRVSEEEYGRLHTAAISAGSRSISDFARDHLFYLARTFPPAAIDGKVDRLSEALADLNGEIRRLRSRLPDPV